MVWMRIGCTITRIMIGRAVRWTTRSKRDAGELHYQDAQDFNLGMDEVLLRITLQLIEKRPHATFTFCWVICLHRS